MKAIRRRLPLMSTPLGKASTPGGSFTLKAKASGKKKKDTKPLKVEQL